MSSQSIYLIKWEFEGDGENQGQVFLYGQIPYIRFYEEKEREREREREIETLGREKKRVDESDSHVNEWLPN